MRKIATVSKANGGSRRARMSILAPPSFLGGSLVFRNRTHMMQKKAQINPIILIAQGNPTASARFQIRMGKMIPPNPPAVAAIPVARARRR